MNLKIAKIIGNKKIMIIKPYWKNTAKAYVNSYKNLIVDIIDFILTSIYGAFEILKNILELLICIIIGILNVLINTIATIIDFLPLIIINKGE